MTLFNRPGLSISPLRPTRRAQGLLRSDVPVLIGYTTRGPAGEPVRIESLRQFQAIFGAPLAGTHLFDAVRGFFETGGVTAYVLRVVGPCARAAQTACGPQWQAAARTSLSALGPLDQFAEDLPWFDHLRRSYGADLPDPGAWANDLTLVLTRQTRQHLSASFAPTSRDLMLVDTKLGLSARTLCLASQASSRQVVQISDVDALRGQISLTKPLDAGFDPARPVALQTLTYDAEILLQGQRAELFTDLALDPDHPASITARLNRTSRFLSLDYSQTKADWTDASLWPAEGAFALSQGSADLAGLTQQSWIDALQSQARVDEIALLALPDLVLQPVSGGAELPASSLAPLGCDAPEARPNAALAGFVVDAATGLPINGAQVFAAGQSAQGMTDAQGFFYLGGLVAELVDLRLAADGYVLGETFRQSSTAAQAFAPPAPPPPLAGTALPVIALAAIDTIHSFDAAQVQAIQRATLDFMGDYRIAVVDPPAPDLAPEALLDWRAGLGQSARIFAAAPWLSVASDDRSGLTNQPASGHICGAFASAERAQGVHRAPANIALRHAKGLSVDLDEATLAAFHAQSLNPLRALPGRGLRLMGSRTLWPEADWRQVSVRRLFDAIEKTLAARLAWAVFEPDSPTTRAILGFSISQFLETLRQRGMFAGTTAAEGYAVVCDGSNNTPASAARGELSVDIGIAPTQPYEFIRISLTAQADAIEVTEAT